MGIDLVEIVRINHLLGKFPERAKRRLFTEIEQIYCNERPNPALHYGARFAAKEAFSKAIGIGIIDDLTWLDVWVEKNERGAPSLFFTERLHAELKQRGIVHWHLSLTHTKRYASAVVVLET